jgi:hypothetical protein
MTDAEWVDKRGAEREIVRLAAEVDALKRRLQGPSAGPAPRPTRETWQLRCVRPVAAPALITRCSSAQRRRLPDALVDLMRASGDEERGGEWGREGALTGGLRLPLPPAPRADSCETKSD